MRFLNNSVEEPSGCIIIIFCIQTKDDDTSLLFYLTFSFRDIPS